jgi:hypothetical protein
MQDIVLRLTYCETCCISYEEAKMEGAAVA